MDSFVFPFYTDYRALLQFNVRETERFTRVRKYDQLIDFLAVYSRIVSLRCVRVVRFE